MQERLFSIYTPSPQGFSSCSVFQPAVFRKGPFALYAPSDEEAREFLIDYLPRLSGIILIPGNQYDVRRIAPQLSQITILPSMFPCLTDFAVHQLGLLKEQLDSDDRCTFLALENKRHELNSQRAAEEFGKFRASLLHEIEERRATESALYQSEQRFRAIFDQTFQFIGLLSLDGIILEANRAALELVDVDAEIIGKAFWEMPWWSHSPGMQEQLRQAIKKAAEGEFVRFEATYMAVDGHLRWADFSLKPIADKTGKVVQLIPEGRDITERKQAEEELRLSEELFHTLCNAAPLGIFRTDDAGNNLYCSSGWEKITGMAAADGKGQSWLNGIHPDDLKDHLQSWKEAVAAGLIHCHEHRRLTSQNKTIWVRTLVSPLKSPEGRISGYVGTMEEITELRQAGEDQLKSQKIESLGILAGGIAHDFNNILTIILGNISLARLQLGNPEKVTSRLEEAENATVRAKDLAQQLLTFARGGEPVKENIELHSLLREAAGFALHGSNVKGKFLVADDLLPVEADEGQLGQVIQNLVLNAVQAMPEGGTVTVEAENIAADEQAGNIIKISITDTGAGISNEHLQRIFDPYFTTKQKGSGLGLATCYSIIMKHGGRIEAASTLGKGSTFRLFLPASKQQNTIRKSSEKGLFRGSGHVLVMDDEEDIRHLTEVMLADLGYTVESVENGSRAVELYRKKREEKRPFAAVILDLTIPGEMGGKEAMDRMLGIDPDIKAIVSSGYSTDPIMANYRDYGFSAVLVKPYRLEDISKVLQQVLAG